MISMKMMIVIMAVVMTMRMLVSCMPMIVRVGYRRTGVNGDRRDKHSANPRERDVEMIKSLVFQEAQGKDENAAQSQSNLLLTP